MCNWQTGSFTLENRLETWKKWWNLDYIKEIHEDNNVSMTAERISEHQISERMHPASNLKEV